MISIIGVDGIPEVTEGADLGALLYEAAGDLRPDDIVVVTQKIVSKAEGRLFPASEKDRVIADESVRVLRRLGSMCISETRQGFVCANAGVDGSNVPPDTVAALPLDADASARRIRSRLEHLTGGLRIGVVISDTFGRAWRLGQTDVAVGVAGFDPFTSYVGTHDAVGRELSATNICTADELAAAAELTLGKATGICAAIVRGAEVRWGRGTAASIARHPAEDLFR